MNPVNDAAYKRAQELVASMTEEEKLELANDETEAIYNTLVYSVYGNEAVYYHATKVCRTQTNGRELTVRDALREGLEPCPNCNPPTVDS